MNPLLYQLSYAGNKPAPMALMTIGVWIMVAGVGFEPTTSGL